MKQEIKDRLIKLLESGEYNHGKHRLYTKDNDAHCPLGVLVEMAIDEGVWEPKLRVDFETKVLDINNGLLNPEIRQWAGIDKSETHRITVINDHTITTNYSPVIKYIKENL